MSMTAYQLARARIRRGEVFIRTRFGEVPAADYFPGLSPTNMIEDEDFRKVAGVEGGPFSYTDNERLMPF